MGGVRVVIQRHARFQYLPHQWSGGEGGRHQPRELATLTRYLVLSCMLVLATWPVHAAEELRSFDHNKDGKVDQREYYHGSTLIRVEIDRDRTGLVDE